MASGEFVRTRESFRGDAPGIGPVAAPIGKFRHRQGEQPVGGAAGYPVAAFIRFPTIAMVAGVVLALVWALAGPFVAAFALSDIQGSRTDAARHQFVVYGISFAIIGQFWVIHHRAFHHLSGHDRWLAYVNLVFLFALSFLPFAANLFGQYRDNRTAVILYGEARMLDGIRQGLDDMHAGRGRPAEEVFEEIRREFSLPPDARPSALLSSRRPSGRSGPPSAG